MTRISNGRESKLQWKKQNLDKLNKTSIRRILEITGERKVFLTYRCLHTFFEHPNDNIEKCNRNFLKKKTTTIFRYNFGFIENE